MKYFTLNAAKLFRTKYQFILPHPDDGPLPQPGPGAGAGGGDLHRGEQDHVICGLLKCKHYLTQAGTLSRKGISPLSHILQNINQRTTKAVGNLGNH